MRFADRRDAGQHLARALAGFAGENPIVLALPRGGVVIGAEVARTLQAPLDVLIVRKLGAPFEPEFGFGAIAEDGSTYLNEDSVRSLGLRPHEIERIAARELTEIERRAQAYRRGRSAPQLRGKTVIIVDDGLATGSTAEAAIRAVKGQDPKRVILAVPVAPVETVERLEPEVDRLVCLQTPPYFLAVGQHYDEFPQVEDAEVIDLLERAARGPVAQRGESTQHP